MIKEVHGHEVIQMMIDSGRIFTKDSLRKEIVNKFGSDTRFYTCSSQNMTTLELIEFLINRRKFQIEDGGFTTHQDHICNH